MDSARLQYLDRMTVIIDRLAQEFGVSWRTAALRAISLDLMTKQDLDDIADLARQERFMEALKNG
jgi:hypothetical protein